MSATLIIKEEITFKANKNTVWDLIINPKKTKQYMFGCEVLSDWKIGNQILWKGLLENGTEIIYVKGIIKEYKEGEKVTFTMFDPNIGIADVPENYIKLTYELIAKEKGCLLKIAQGDFNGTEHAIKRFEESKQGWKMVIPLMKNVLNE